MTALRLSLALTLLSSCGMMEEQTRLGTQVILMPAGQRVAVSINGEEHKRLDQPVSLALGPGTHTIAVRDGLETTVTLEPFDKLVVPIVPRQCFASLNITYSNYGGGAQKVPKLSGRMRRDQPFPMPDDHHVSNDAAPSSISAGQQVFLLSSKSCHELDDLEFGLNGKVTREDGSTDPVAGGVAKVRRAACQTDAKSVWCTALTGWSGVSASPLPTAPQAFIGLAVATVDGTELELKPDTLSISTLAMNPKGAKLGILNPYGEGGKKTGLDVAAGSLVQVLRSEGDALSIGPDFAGYLGRQAEKAEGPFAADGVGWSTDGAHIRQVGDRWVSVQVMEGGAIVAINSPYAAEGG